MLQLDGDGRVESINPEAMTILGPGGTAMMGRPFVDCLEGTDARIALHDLLDALTREAEERPHQPVSSFSRDLRLVSPHGPGVGISARALHVPGAPPARLVVLSPARTDSQRRLGQVVAAQRDGLTGLPNRHLLLERLRGALSALNRRPGRVGVLFLDLDHMKAVNDRLGHQAGDMFLCDVAARLRSTLREGDTVARIGGDEFVAVIPDAESVEQVWRVARRVSGVIRQPLVTKAETLEATMSIGIAVTDDPGADPDALLRDADTAMYVSKRERRGEPVLFDPSLRDAANQRVEMEADLRQAIMGDEIEPYFQPIVTFDGRVRGAEALARWRHPSRGLLPPAEFLPLAEEAGLVHGVWLAVVEGACRALRTWGESGRGRDCYVSLNLSPQQFTRSGLATHLAESVSRSGIDPGRVRVEVTETALIEDAALAHRVLDELVSAGFGIALDDFGTGYSSLSHLQSFPVSMVKIDLTFTRRIVGNPRDAAIVRAITDLGHGLGMEVCAEGVETRAQAAALVDMGCDVAQGFLWGAALPASSMPERLEAA